MNDYNSNIRLLIEAATELISVADKGQAECVDENCMSLYGLAKDTGYRLRNAAEREYAAHDAKFAKSGREVKQ